MIRRARKSTVVAMALLAALAVGACGSSHSKVSTGTYAGESGANAPYLDVGPLTYEVQLSRQLNPFDVEDSAYLQGLTLAQRRLLPGEEWFGVFLQVYNNGSTATLAAPRISIFDTQGNAYTQVFPGQTNDFAYRGGVVPPGGRLPVLDSVAANGVTQGALVLFKIRTAS